MYRAVITGDIMGSSNYGGRAKRAYLDTMLTTALKNIFTAKKDKTDIYRGDSFQIETDATQVLRKAIQLRTFIIKESEGATDAYLAIGIGKILYEANTTKQSDGEAYQLSGKTFEQLQKGINMQMKTAWTDWNGLFNAIAILCDSILNNLTANQAEAIYHSLFDNKTQTEIAKELDLKQSSISARLKGGHFDALKEAIENYETSLIKIMKKA